MAPKSILPWDSRSPAPVAAQAYKPTPEETKRWATQGKFSGGEKNWSNDDVAYAAGHQGKNETGNAEWGAAVGEAKRRSLTPNSAGGTPIAAPPSAAAPPPPSAPPAAASSQAMASLQSPQSAPQAAAAPARMPGAGESQYQIYKPNAPGGSRELQKDLFTGSDADIQKRKASGEDISYSKVDAPPPTAAPPPASAPPQPMASLTGGGGGGAAPPPVAAPSQAMASLVGGGGDAGPMGMDVSQSGPSGLRQGLGQRFPPQYNYALASLGRGVY